MSVVLTASSSLEEQLPLPARNSAQTTRSLTEFGTVLFAIFLLTLLLAAMTYGIHRWRVGRQKSRGRSRGASSDAQSRMNGTSSSPARRRRRRRSRRANPSLAETGGLPPRRSNRSSPLHPFR